jgi:tetratricopeptide (TPR) repeat protein
MPLSIQLHLRIGRALLLSLCITVYHAFAQTTGNGEAERYYNQGRAALSAGNFEEARRDYEALSKLSPGIAEVHATLGAIYFQQKNFSQALEALFQAQHLKPDLPKLSGLIAMSLTELGRYNEALPELEKAFRESGDLPVKRLSGLLLERAYTALQFGGKAVEVALELERLFGDDPEVLYNNERIYGNYAFLTVQKLMKIAPNSVWRHQAAAEAQESQGNYVGAIAEYRTVLTLDPGRSGIHYRLGRTLLAKWHATQLQADRDAAREEFGLELQADPDNSDAAYEIGEMYRQDGKLQDAQTFFESAVKAHPDFPEAQVGLANVFASQDRWQEALPHLERAVSIRPDDQVAWYRLSQAYRSSGNSLEQKKALSVFQQLHERSLKEREITPHEVTQQVLETTP